MRFPVVQADITGLAVDGSVDETAMPMTERDSPLARYLLIAYVLLTAYASLYPFSGWRDLGVSPLAFLGAVRPRYITGFDVAVNILGYAPLGFLVVLALYPVRRGARAVALALAAGVVLSVSMEAFQTYLPNRVPSNVDSLFNIAGALLGAIVAAPLTGVLLREDGLKTLRYRLFRRGRGFDLGLVLLGLWLLSQLNPNMLLFGNGDLRELFQAKAAVFHPPALFIRVEAFVAGANVASTGLLLSLLVTRGQPARALFLVVIVAGFAVRSLAYGMLLSPPSPLLWVSPGAILGVTAGVLLVLVVAGWSRRAQLALCGLLLMAATAVVNLAPANPYLVAALPGMTRGLFLNFNGLTRLLSSAWPFLALAYLFGLAARHGRAAE